MNSQSDAEQSLSRRNSGIFLDATPNSPPARRFSASSCRLTAGSWEISRRRLCSTKVLRNVLRQRMGEAQSGSRASKASAAGACSHGKYMYTGPLESTMAMACLLAWPDQYRSRGTSAVAKQFFAPSHGQVSRSAPARSVSVQPRGTRWPRCSCCAGASGQRSSSAHPRRQGSSKSTWWASRLHGKANKVVPLLRMASPVGNDALRAGQSPDRAFCGVTIHR